jgi:MSHA biogenesis protein MshN
VSLINQVLKDLEQRHASEMADATHNLDGLALASPVRKKSTSHSSLLFSVIGLVVVVSSLAVWWWQYRVSVPTGGQTDTISAPAVVQPLTSPVPMMTHTTSTPKPAAPVVAQSPRHPTPEPAAAPALVSEKPPKVARVHSSKVTHAPVEVKEQTQGMEKQRVPMSSEQKAELAYQEGYDQLSQHNVRRAEQVLQKALVIDPGHGRARELLAGIMIKQGRWIETADLMQQGVQISPGNMVFVKLYARTLMQLNRDKQAIKLMREHAPPLAQDPDFYALLAALYQRQQDHLAAATTYSEILKLRPDTGIWWVGFGISLEAMGKQQEAQQAYSRARKTGSLHGDLARYTDNRLLALDAIKYPIE